MNIFCHMQTHSIKIPVDNARTVVVSNAAQVLPVRQSWHDIVINARMQAEHCMRCSRPEII